MADNKLTLAQQIERPEMVAKFSKALGNNTNKAQSFLRSIMLATQGNSMLKDADPMSILSAGMIAASLGLEINPSLGYSAIVPYKKDGVAYGQFQLMTNGLIQMFFRSGQAKALNPFVVYADEYNGFDKIKGELKPLKEHDEKCTEVAGYGCYIELVNGFSKTEYWSAEKVKSHALRYSQAYRSGKDCPWKTAYEQMALKTVVKYTLVHYAPKTTELQMAINADQAIVNYKDDDSFSFNYADNDFEYSFSEEEQAQRNDYLIILKENNIDEESLKVYYKKDSISQISTEELRKRVEVVIQAKEDSQNG